MKNVQCDECKEIFEIGKIKSKKVGSYKGNDVRFTYFDCDSCKKKYFVGIREKEYNKLLAKMKRDMKKLSRLVKADDRDIIEIEKLQREIKTLQGEIFARSEMLKALFVLK